MRLTFSERANWDMVICRWPKYYFNIHFEIAHILRGQSLQESIFMFGIFILLHMLINAILILNFFFFLKRAMEANTAIRKGGRLNWEEKWLRMEDDGDLSACAPSSPSSLFEKLCYHVLLKYMSELFFSSLLWGPHFFL